jgi:alpha-mannosidase
MKTKLLTALFVFLFANLLAQVPKSENITLANGYADKVSGVDFWYHSSIQVAKESMLIRATDGNSFMEWRTAPAPRSFDKEFVTFVWLAGIGSSPGIASFDVAVNAEKRFTFFSDGSDEWTLQSEDGSSLYFKKDFIDQHGDRFGFMYLNVPSKNLKPGEPLTLRVTGGNFGKTSWYMTFKFPLESGLNFKALPALTKIDGKDYQLGIAGIFHLGEPAKARIFIDGRLLEETNVNFGYNHVRVMIPAVRRASNVNYRLEVAGNTWRGRLRLEPVRNWQVNFVHHTHTDIGYTRSQTDILGDHLRFIDYALDYCDNTDHFPEESQFRWTCEASWAVDEYLKSRPQSQIDRLLKRIEEGRIEVTGMYFNFNELPDEQILAASLQPLKRFRELGIDVKTAMQNDVNGFGWSLLDYYNDLDVKYVNMGTHGHRALICFDKPTLFWWESPSGKRMLAYRGEHYMIGNTRFWIHGGDFNQFEDELLTYLLELEKLGYEYDLISIQHSGFITDNSPPSIAPAEMIRQWNEKYTWPKLRTATATSFFEEMEQKHGDSFMVIRGAWPDWWTDGFGASAREVAATRMAQSDLIANTAGLTMAAVKGAKLPEKISDRIETINSALLFYTEHTVGYSESVREPFHRYTMEQRAIKESYAWEASRRARMLGEETLGLLQSYFSREDKPSLLVFNTLSWNRSGLFTVYIDYQIIPRDAAFTITDANGRLARAQVIERHSDGAYWSVWVDDIPAFGFKKYLIEVAAEKPLRPQPAPQKEMEVFENQWYRIVIDNGRGAITSITDKELNLELVDQSAEWKMGEFIYELLDNRSQMESFRLDNYTRVPLEEVWFERYEEGDVWNSIRFRGNTSAAHRDGTYVFEVRLFNTAKRIDLFYEIEKKLVTDPEGIYIAFPLALDNGQLSFDVQGGEIRAGIDQIPGSTNDWNTVQNYARLWNGQSQLMLSSAEMPLMQFGGINTGRFQAGATPETTHIYGWPMNNHWVTNFNPYQLGGHIWTYTLTSRAGNAMTDATRFGWGHRTPFLARVVPGGGKGDDLWQGSLIEGWSENILLVSAIPEQDGKSAIFHVRETGGKNGTFSLHNGRSNEPLKVVQVDVTGHELTNETLEIKPFESKFFRVYF